ncbi:MAG: TonB family protein [Georgfuchsia sp.]
MNKSPPEQVVQPVISSSEKPATDLLVRKPPPPNLPPKPVTASIAKLETRPQEPVEKSPVASVEADATKIVAPAAGVAVLSTDKESTWSRPAEQALQDAETLNKQEVTEQTDTIEQKIEDQVQIEVAQAALEAVARENELALERTRAEEQAAEARAREEESLVQQAEADNFAAEKAAEKILEEEQKIAGDQARIEAEQAALEVAAQEKARALERERAEEQARLEAMKAEQAAAARAREEAALAQQAEAEALARKREADKLAAEKILAEQQKIAEEQARIEAEKAVLETAAREKELALERRRAEEQVRLEAMKAEQAAAARAKEAALAQQAEADKLAAEKILAEQQMHLLNKEAGKPGGDREGGNGNGSDLVRRAIDAIRGGQMDLPGIKGAEPFRPRRGSILGRDSKDIQLAFYGEGWRQKIERIGSLNYPALSKNLAYDPLVVTVSINSDGTLVGVRIVKSSGHKNLDEAVLRIVTMSAPFSPFPPAMKRLYDVVDITRTWIFLEYRPRIASE